MMLATDTRANGSMPEELIEQIWHDVGESIPRGRVTEVAVEVAAKYRDATITAFIPLIVRRMTKERLQAEIVKSAAAESHPKGTATPRATAMLMLQRWSKAHPASAA